MDNRKRKRTGAETKRRGDHSTTGRGDATVEIAGRRPRLQDIADAAGWSIGMASRFFNTTDRKQWRDTTLTRARRIARYLGITLDELADAVLRD